MSAAGHAGVIPAEDHGHALCEGDCISRKSHTTIHQLPSDVVIDILRDVFEAARKPAIADRWSTNGEIVELDPWPPSLGHTSNPHHDYPCPETLASVSPVWREAMSNVSIFWTHLVSGQVEIPPHFRGSANILLGQDAMSSAFTFCGGTTHLCRILPRKLT
ncbi:hypothetical protein DAEQUDRAFT_215376 [Daedalea quercina L-15889]|uniref:F-box domain-containing protein n=1 Tax=Daedalea quercina L-15889 TaxID=1314783 RepID=A0A165R3W8_9APHY|nr:hypothetical protein DAEQUDRAFT_215376 [Daedalea quercina L-15889]